MAKSSKNNSLSGLLPAVLIYTACIASLGALLFGIVFLSATQEATAFNRFTNGPKATTWDAVWLELRVEACGSQVAR
jgi:hypothetical protein